MQENNPINTCELLPSSIKLDKYSWNPISLSLRTSPSWTWDFSPQTFLCIFTICMCKPHRVVCVFNFKLSHIIFCSTLKFWASSVQISVALAAHFLLLCYFPLHEYATIAFPYWHMVRYFSLFCVCWRNCCCECSQARSLGAWTLFLTRKDGNLFPLTYAQRNSPITGRGRAVAEQSPVLQVAGRDKGTSESYHLRASL